MTPKFLLARLLQGAHNQGHHEKMEALADMFSKAIGAAIADDALPILAFKWFGFGLSPKE